MTILETSDLVLREWESQDEAALIAIAQQPHIQHWLPDWGHPEEWIGKWIVNVHNHYQINNPHEKFISYAVTLRDTGEVIGQMNVGGGDFDGEKVGIAYFMGERHLRHGYTTQAASAFTDYLFDRYGYDDLNSLVQPANIASNKVLMDAGYTNVGIIVKQLDGFPAPKEFNHWRKERPQS